MNFRLLILKPLLTFYFKELSEKKDLLKKCEENFEVLKKKFGVAIHRQGLVYDEIQEQKKVFLLADIHPYASISVTS